MRLNSKFLEELKLHLKRINKEIENVRNLGDLRKEKGLIGDKQGIIKQIEILQSEFSSGDNNSSVEFINKDTEVKGICFSDKRLKGFIKKGNTGAYFICEISNMKNYFFDISIIEKNNSCSIHVVSNYYLKVPDHFSKLIIQQLLDKKWTLKRDNNHSNLYQKLFDIKNDNEIEILITSIHWLAHEIFNIDNLERIKVRYDLGLN